ncbi:hypothetical protein OG909_12790 [Streptomyces sp. NBC_01754]|uniref:hypothetical protein n=1 Tax=Streptomyces sp. NBC_01754 TaxID=2975930 RepID=UPI002DDA53B5|nr:hypothetical protein [Streptomyces sp. NBC_01754]WSC93098.1 hypothetical protein OG909_12790 [Streptomyces sp. NBC_01754]
MTAPGISRRALLGRTSALAGAAALAAIPGSALLATPAYADSSYSKTPTGEEITKAYRRFQRNKAQVRTDKSSTNGWEMEKTADGGGSIASRPVPGTPLAGVGVRTGDVETVLIHVVRRFHYEISELRRGDVIGWRSPGTVRKGLPEGNQASGTAVQIRPGFYPSGTKGGFFAQELVVLRDILAELDGVVRWGGDDRHADEALFYIDVEPGASQLTEVAQRIRAWNHTPGRGAGAPVDVQATGRRTASRSLEHRQQAAA